MKRSKIKVYSLSDDKELHVFWCPGCKSTHTFEISDKGWNFSGDFENPTYLPSLRYENCHLNLRKGVICFDQDCKHHLAGQEVPLQEHLL